MQYKEYLKTEHWVNTRNKRVFKSNYKCELCLSAVNLNVHHKRYTDKDNNSILYREKSGNLITLCRECHYLYHKYFGFRNINNKRRQRIINLIHTGINKDDIFKIISNKSELTYKEAMSSANISE